MRVDTKVIYPSVEGPTSILAKDANLQKLLCDHEQELPRPHTFILQNKKVGIIIIGGYIKNLSFENTLVDTRVSKCDAIALCFNDNLSYPVGDYNNDQDIDLLSNHFKDVEGYFQLPQMIQLLIMGVEQTLLRRVVAVGQGVDGISKWISVPKNRIQIVETPAQENS
jgi:hypothetical protein